MSAFIVSDRHISAMLTAGLTSREELSWYWPEYNAASQYEIGQPWGPGQIAIAQETRNTLTRRNANQVGSMLLSENQKSVNHRYNEKESSMGFVYQLAPRLTNIEILKLIDCYEYQACEHPQWAKSEAKKFCETLRHRMISTLPGYDAAGWGI